VPIDLRKRRVFLVDTVSVCYHVHEVVCRSLGRLLFLKNFLGLPVELQMV
jgi:hypothetical protein